MKTNTLLTYLLYALLTGLICVAGYKACQMKRDQARSAKENEEFQKTLKDLGYLEEDSTGSQYTGDGSADTSLNSANTTSSGSTGTVSKDGIEDEPAASTAPPKTSTKPVVTQQPAATTSKPATQPATRSKSGSTTAPNPVSSLDKAPKASTGRYSVLAGTFTKLEGARRQMEDMIQMGYHDAEISHINNGKHAVVVIKRTNSRSEADQLVAKLKAKNVDARVWDRKQQ